MSDLAKKARAAMKSKASRLGRDRPLEKVDSSTWTPPEMLNADVKTGMRPVSRRAYKKGGKVVGDANKTRADRAPRKNGGSSLTADSLINRNVKSANEQREGKKHIGGMKKGGRAKFQTNGRVSAADAEAAASGMTKEQIADRAAKAAAMGSAANRGPTAAEQETMRRIMEQSAAANRKSGGRAKKAAGGPDMGDFGPGVAGAAEMMKRAGRAGVPGGGLYGSGFTNVKRGSISPAKAVGMGAKKGGTVKHEDEAADKALIRKMVKSSARTGKKDGGERAARATGGNVFSGPSYPGKVPGATGGRTAKAAGGKTRGKGKTNINIVIAAGKPAGGQDMMAPPPGALPTDNRGPGGIPVPMSSPPGGAGAGMPGGGMPIPMPIPMPAAGGPQAPAGGMPMARKSGGRAIAKSYKDMCYGAGSGEGRLQKTDIAKTGKGAPTFKRGGKVYRSYKDMDAGAGSGEGRLEKSEIQSRKK